MVDHPTQLWQFSSSRAQSQSDEHLEDDKVTNNRQHWSIQNTPCQTDIISSYGLFSWLRMRSMILEELKSGHTNGWKAQFTDGALSNRMAAGILHGVCPRCVIIEHFH